MALRPLVCLSGHKLRSMCKSQGMRLSLRTRGSKNSRPACLPPVTPWLVNLLDFLLLATWCIFTRDVYPQNTGWAVIVGLTFVSVSVCWSQREERGSGCWQGTESFSHCFSSRWYENTHVTHTNSDVSFESLHENSCYLLSFHLNRKSEEYLSNIFRPWMGFVSYRSLFYTVSKVHYRNSLDFF